MLGVLHCCGSIRSRLGRGSVHSCNSVPKCTRINLRTSEIAKISWVGGACPQTPLVNANFARILHMPWLDHLNLACSDISGAREFTSCPSESLPTVKQQLNSSESYTVWLVIFAKYLFSRFSRVKSHSRKFCCPRVKRMNRVSIPSLLLYSSLQKRVSECAFDGYHKCYVNTDTQSRQRCKAESENNRRGPQIHRSRKLKPRKFLKS